MRRKPFLRVAQFDDRKVTQFEHNVREKFDDDDQRLRAPFLFPSEWAAFSPSLRSFDGTATIGNGSTKGRYRQVGDTVEVEQYIEWGTTTTLGVSPTPFLLLTMPPQKSPDRAKLITPDGFTAAVFQLFLAGTVAGTVSQGATYQGLVTVFLGAPIVLVAIPAILAAAFITGDSVLFSYRMPVTESTGA